MWIEQRADTVADQRFGEDDPSWMDRTCPFELLCEFAHRLPAGLHG
jgi:hypothetical protein